MKQGILPAEGLPPNSPFYSSVMIAVYKQEEFRGLPS